MRIGEVRDVCLGCGTGKEGGAPGLVWLGVPVLFFVLVSGGVLLSHAVSRAVPSALVGLTSGFGMGPGVSPPLWPP